VQHLKTTAEAFRLHLVGASQKRRIIDKIQERDRESHALEGIRVEQAESDEMTSTRYHFNRSRAQKSV
jgi:flagellar export protein FliJ